MTETVSGQSQRTGENRRRRPPAAGAGHGLTIDRIFTTPGVHPYDDVSWQRRDVVQQNWKTGETVFEQRGVEFPDFWSVNASTIVTTKYFRGALGTDVREWSLRQLVDRVVKTYRRAGEEYGYFATPDDAEVFEHELTWMLVHQVFSFNSPVWFNVGTPSPQQVSACQPYDALVNTPAGLVPIGKLVEDDAVGTKVYDAHGVTRIVATKANGMKDVLRLHTRAGHQLDVTADHLVWRSTGDGIGRFVRAEVLVGGDCLEHIDAAFGSTTQYPEIARVENLGSMEVYDIQTESGEYLSGGLRVHNCFILAVDDSMDSILNWYREEGLIFKGGSGSGINLSRIRSSKELLSSGGTASGPVSFMRGADASAGTIKSGGATRRAAKMVVLDVDHPDIDEFIETKAREEDKIRALRDAGFDMDLGGKDIVSVQYQNANNSVRVSDEFMQAVENGDSFGLRARLTGEVVETVDAKKLFRSMAQAAWECADPGIQYDSTINDWHTCPETGRITASNPCSEYVHLDNSSCNLSSLNLLKFLQDDGTFDAELFRRCVELIITAMDISINFADFPTTSIRDTTRAYRQLGIGYANLGALLMATGRGYDSAGGRSLAAAITSLMTGAAYKRSAELARVVGPYDGFARNAEAHSRVMRKHAAASDALRTVDELDEPIHALATKVWQECLALGKANGWRNAQASVLAPTGCLTGDTLITTDRGLARLSELGDVWGEQWQPIEATVSTDDGSRQATQFFINGEEPTRRIVTKAGYRVQGTYAHRIKVVDQDTGEWVWKRLADVLPGDVVPIQLGTLVGPPRMVPLPVLGQAHYTNDQAIFVPEAVDAELAELVGYFMGDGSLNSDSISLCVAEEDSDVVERLRVLCKGLFGLDPDLHAKEGYTDVTLQSIRLARWWKAVGFAKGLPSIGHSGKVWTPHVPAAIRESNDPTVYAAFLRGLFEADGTLSKGVPCMTTASEKFVDDIRTLLTMLGIASTSIVSSSGWGGPVYLIRLRNVDHTLAFDEIVGFMGARKSSQIRQLESPQTARNDRVRLPSAVWATIAPHGHELWSTVRQQLATYGAVNRVTARLLYHETLDDRLAFALSYLFETVAKNEDGGVQPTYDLSVPENLTYVAAGFVSHNTIGLMMDCDTTGVEPDLALVKFKKLVGGGSMQIVNQTVPRALRRLGYQEEQIEAIVEHIAEHGNVIDAPGLRTEDYEVFDCAMGARSISPMGHVDMIAAVQPHLSGSVSKTVNMHESAAVDEIEHVYFQGWKLGLKALAIYRDNCKVGQPLSLAKRSKVGADAAKAEAERDVVVEYRPTRRRLPKSRPSRTTSFTVGGAEGYMTAGSYPDDGLGEVFLKLGKQGSTLAGVMDAFSIAISIALQYGVPLETYVQKFTNMRFEPSGMTDDPDVRMAQSVVDYIFRRLALDYLPFESRSALGIHTAAERARQLDTGEYAPIDDEVDVEALRQSAPVEQPAAEAHAAEAGEVEEVIDAGAKPAPEQAHTSTELLELLQGTSTDAPLCFTCGTKMRPAGSCYVCEGCGSTSGCS